MKTVGSKHKEVLTNGGIAMERIIRSWIRPVRSEASNGVAPRGGATGVSVTFRATGDAEERMLGIFYDSLTRHHFFSTESKTHEIGTGRGKHTIVVRLSFLYLAGSRRRPRLSIRRPPEDDFAGRMLFDQLVDLLRARVQHIHEADGYDALHGTARALTITFVPAPKPEA